MTHECHAEPTGEVNIAVAVHIRDVCTDSGIPNDGVIVFCS